jgi:hypothetical protein
MGYGGLSVIYGLASTNVVAMTFGGGNAQVVISLVAEQCAVCSVAV